MRPHLTQRQVRLRREDQDEQGDGQVEVTLDHAQPDADRDEGDREGGQQLQHQRGQEGDPQGGHGLAAVRRVAALQPFGLGPGASEDLQGGQSGDEVGEVVGEPRLDPLPTGDPGLGHPAHQDHEERDERQGQRDDRGGDPVGAQDGDPHHQRDRDGQHQLGKIAREVAVEGIEPLRHHGDEGRGVADARSHAGRHRISTPQAGLDDVGAQLGLDRGGGPVGEDLVEPAQQRTSADDRDQDGQTAVSVGRRRRATAKVLADGVGQQPGLRDDQDRGGGADRDPGGEVRPRRPSASRSRRGSTATSCGTSVEPRQCTSAGMDARVTRLRKTQ